MNESRGWKLAVVAAVVIGLLLAGAVFVVMRQRNDDLARQLAAAEAALTTATTTTTTTTSTTSTAPAPTFPNDLEGVDELFDDLMGGGQMDDLLDDLLGEDGLGDLGQGGPGTAIDPRLTQCLAGNAIGSGGGIPEGDVDEQVAAIADLITVDRGISSDDTLDIEFTTRQDLAARARALNDEAMTDEEADAQSRLYSALGVIGADEDIERLLLDALDEAVAGFYDSDTDELVIGSEEIDALGALIVAHEIQHAVADDVLGLPDLEAIEEQAGSDAALGALALVEGDASLISQQFMLEHLSFEEILAVTMESLTTQEALTAVPHLVSRQLQFPYQEGLAFTCGLYLDGGWESVDAAYADLPTTSAQILFADRYPDEAPVDLPDPPTPTGWAPVESDTLGAATLLFLLEAPGDDPDAALVEPLSRVEAWAGGEVSTWSRDEETAMLLSLADRGGPIPLCDTMVDFAAATYGVEPVIDGDTTRVESDGRLAVVDCQPGVVRLAVAPDDTTIAAVLG